MIFQVMDIAHGGELFDRIGDGPLDEFSAAAIVKNILKALAYLHKEGIMHRDIKPENVLIGSPDGTDVLIADFGEALKADWSDECVGTPQYMAPEVKPSPYTDTAASKLPHTTACIAITPHRHSCYLNFASSHILCLIHPTGGHSTVHPIS